MTTHTPLSKQQTLWEKDDIKTHIEEVLNKAIVSHLEDGGLWVLVDGHDYLAVLHPCQVLDGAGDTHSNVQVLCA